MLGVPALGCQINTLQVLCSYLEFSQEVDCLNWVELVDDNWNEIDTFC